MDINTATAAQLRTVKGIGEKKAEAIVEGPYSSVDDLDKVKGVGAKTLEKWRSICAWARRRPPRPRFPQRLRSRRRRKPSPRRSNSESHGARGGGPRTGLLRRFFGADKGGGDVKPFKVPACIDGYLRDRLRPSACVSSPLRFPSSLPLLRASRAPSRRLWTPPPRNAPLRSRSRIPGCRRCGGDRPGPRGRPDIPAPRLQGDLFDAVPARPSSPGDGSGTRLGILEGGAGVSIVPGMLAFRAAPPWWTPRRRGALTIRPTSSHSISRPPAGTRGRTRSSRSAPSGSPTAPRSGLLDLRKPGGPIPEEISGITGITEEMVWDAPAAPDALRGLLGFAGAHPGRPQRPLRPRLPPAADAARPRPRGGGRAEDTLAPPGGSTRTRPATVSGIWRA